MLEKKQHSGIFQNQPFPGRRKSIYHLLASLKYIIRGKNRIGFSLAQCSLVSTPLWLLYTAAYIENKSQGNLNTVFHLFYLSANTAINFILKNTLVRTNQLENT